MHVAPATPYIIHGAFVVCKHWVVEEDLSFGPRQMHLLMFLLDVIAADLNVFLLADAVIGISCAVLVLLYIFQRLGTSKLGVAFAPVILLWFFSNFCVGIYNIVTWYPGAPSPSPSSYQLHPALQHECFPAFCVNTLTGPACD